MRSSQYCEWNQLTHLAHVFDREDWVEHLPLFPMLFIYNWSSVDIWREIVQCTRQTFREDRDPTKDEQLCIEVSQSTWVRKKMRTDSIDEEDRWKICWSCDGLSTFIIARSKIELTLTITCCSALGSKMYSRFSCTSFSIGNVSQRDPKRTPNKPLNFTTPPSVR